MINTLFTGNEIPKERKKYRPLSCMLKIIKEQATI